MGSEIVEGGVHYYVAGDEVLVSTDRRTTLMPITMAGNSTEATGNIKDVREALGTTNDTSDFEVLITGQATAQHDLVEINQKDAETGESIAIPIALLILVVVLGAFVAAITEALPRGAIFVVVIAVLASLTLLPAGLSLLGDKINRLSLPILGLRGQPDEEQAAGFWDRVSRGVMRRPVLSLVLGVGLLVAVSLPLLDMTTGIADVGTFPDEIESKQGFVIISQEFPDLLTNRVRVVIDGSIDDPAVQEAIADLRDRMESDGNFGSTALEVNGARDLAVVSAAVTGGDAASRAAITSVKRLRRTLIPDAFDSAPAISVLVAGDTAFWIDFFQVVRDYAPIVFTLVLGMSFLLLTIVFRSIVVAFKSIVMNLLSVGAAYGILVLVFQKGLGTDLLGFQQIDVIMAWLPLFLFAVLFGLSMDYHVFLLSRVRERFDQTQDNAGSVTFGIRTTGRLITGAALIMVAVFSGFAFSGSLVDLQQFGFGMGVAILLDATLVRMVLVPSAMKLLGKWNWYLPRWLSWLPDMRVEAVQAKPEASPAD